MSPGDSIFSFSDDRLDVDAERGARLGVEELLWEGTVISVPVGRVEDAEELRGVSVRAGVGCGSSFGGEWW